MRDYGKVSPQFWIGATGKELRSAGMEAQIVAMYLMTSPHANMLGLYYMPKLYIAHETGLGEKGASKGLARAIEAGFCAYDEASEMVWVFEMARYQIADQLKPDDKRCVGIQNEYNALPANPHLEPFFDKYAASFNLTRKRQESSTTTSPIEAPSKTHRSQEQEQEQEQESISRPRRARPPPKVPLPDDFGVSDRVRLWAEAKGYGRLQERLEHFASKARAKGYLYADWDEAFMEAVRKDWAELNGKVPAGRSVDGGGKLRVAI